MTEDDTTGQARLPQPQMELPPGVQCSFVGADLQVWWDNRLIRKEYGIMVPLAIGWIVFAPLTVALFVGGLLKIPEMPSGLLCAPLLLLWGAGVYGISYAFVSLFRKEGFTVHSDRLDLLSSGVANVQLNVRETLPFGMIDRIEFGCYSHNGTNSETVVTLNVFLKRSWWRNRRMLAYWMKSEDKKIIFRLLTDALSKMAAGIAILSHELGTTPQKALTVANQPSDRTR